jgi:DNA (cytosine-5)-methyltransferase 1
MNKPVLLDIGCRQGGATRGYQQAGFYVIGVDIEPQPRYIGDEFIQADGLKILSQVARDGYLGVRGDEITVSAVHTSWPCQGYTECQRIQGREHPKLIEPGRELLNATGLPYVQENVDSTETRAIMIDPVTLCGTMFGLRTYRHRLFESNIPISVPSHPDHAAQQVKMGRPLIEGDFYQAVGNFSGVDYARRDMGVDWMTREGIRECIPPAYAEHVGRQVLAAASARTQ